jgi:hypothetical protein
MTLSTLVERLDRNPNANTVYCQAFSPILPLTASGTRQQRPWRLKYGTEDDFSILETEFHRQANPSNFGLTSLPQLGEAHR